MKEKLNIFLKKNGIYNNYWSAFGTISGTRTRERWNADLGINQDFFDKQNASRFISGAFDWSEFPLTGRDYGWFNYSNQWRVLLKQPKPTLNENSRVL